MNIQCIPTPVMYQRRRSVATGIGILDESGRVIGDESGRGILPEDYVPPDPPAPDPSILSEDGVSITDEAARKLKPDLALNAPTNFRETGRVYNGDGTWTVSLAWDDTNTDPNDENTYVLTNGFPGDSLDSADATAYDINKADGDVYELAVKAVNEVLGIESPISNVVSLALYSAPQNLTLLGSAGEDYNFEWDALGYGFDHIEIWKSTDGVNYFLTGEADGTDYTLNTADESFFVKVRAKIADNYSDFSNVVEV